MLNSPLAAAARARVYHQRTRSRSRERGLRTFAALFALALHLLFLFGFVLGPAYEVKPPRPSKDQFLQVRLVEPPEPPPPPPVRGTPPKEKGPRHQGRSRRAAASAERSVNSEAVEAAPPAVSAPPVIAKAAKTQAVVAKPRAAPKPPASLPQPAPTAELQPVPLAGEPPVVTVPRLALQPPIPPKFQPESVRSPQLEGTRPLPPPASLVLPELPAQSPPPISVSSIALNTEVPRSTAPASITPARAQLPVAPPVPELQPVPLPAQASPSVTLQTELSAPAPTVPLQKPVVQTPRIEVAETELEAIPLTPITPASSKPSAPAVKVDITVSAPKSAIQTAIERPQLSAPALPAVANAPASTPADVPAKTPSADTARQSAADDAVPTESGKTNEGRDVSTAPDAIPQGSDDATPGQPDGVVAAPEGANGKTAVPAVAAGQGTAPGKGQGRNPGSGQTGGDQPGATQGEKQGALGGYVQLKPHGDTEIMNHGTPNIGYRATRFEQDWAPKGESSVDTALRHAVEKTTLAHTFHLPRGVRVKCAIKPLLPIALFGCANADPPPRPVAAEVYKRMYMTPASPAEPLAPAASTAVAASMVKIDNSAQCSAARVAGAPPPPGCEVLVLPVKRATDPASASSSWVPASDQFH